MTAPTDKDYLGQLLAVLNAAIAPDNTAGQHKAMGEFGVLWRGQGNLIMRFPLTPFPEIPNFKQASLPLSLFDFSRHEGLWRPAFFESGVPCKERIWRPISVQRNRQTAPDLLGQLSIRLKTSFHSRRDAG